MEFTTVLIASFILLVFYLWYRRPDTDLPPFPKTPMPVVGNLLSLEQDPRPQFKKWREQCGDVFSLYMGSKLTVVLNGYDVIREVLVKNGEEFLDRPRMFIDQVTGMPCKGVILNSGPEWKEQRSIMLSILRDFGMGKNILAEKIQEEICCYLDVLASFKGNPTDINTLTSLCFSNVICSIVLGKRFDLDDEAFRKLITMINFIAHYGNGLFNFFPSLHYLPGDFFNSKKVEANSRQLMDLIVKEFLSKMRDDPTDQHNVDSFITAYALERDKKIQAGQATTMDNDNLVRMILDLFGAGSETSATTVYWCILYILHHPDVQDKIFDEIVEEIGTERKPTMSDKLKLTYLNAVIMETQRLANVVPFGLPHTNPKDATINGYKIPKGTNILPNLDSVLHDETVWGMDVMNFKPERFIDDKGKIKTVTEFIPFSLGGRVCLGESLAKMELFLCLSFMFQRFKFLPEKANSPPPMDIILGFTLAPVPFKVKVIDRQS